MIDEDKFISFQKVKSDRGNFKLGIWVLSIFGALLIFIIFVPWTQNVRGTGKVTTLRPEQQPHAINSLISGRIEKWYVIEGEHVKKGDTLAKISEVKTEYFNPDLIENMRAQYLAKSASADAYKGKINALGDNMKAITSEFRLNNEQYFNKIDQKKAKVTSDSANYEAQKVNLSIAETQLKRTDSLVKMGIKSTKDLETAQIKFQKENNYLIGSQNKLISSRNELVNAKLEYQNYTNSYNVKMSKAQSDQFTAISNYQNALKETGELQNKTTNLTIRNNNYYIVSPQNSFVLETYKKGVGEIVKEGDPLVSLIPDEHDLAVEINIKPMDIPLIKLGERNRIIFDGWPSLVFSGWPNTAFGSFGGKVYAIDRNINKKGKYRVLVIPDEKEENWPEQLKLGSGASGIFLLNDVPVWYELWRNINGFPPEYYDGAKSKYQLDDKEIDEKYHTK